MEDKLGLIHIYCGDGKGKTTATMGLALRALGKGLKVLVIQFLKNNKSGELSILETIENAKVLYGAPIYKFTFQMTQQELSECSKKHEESLVAVKSYIEENDVNLLIMDEVINAVFTNTLSEEALLEFLKTKPRNLEVVMSGVKASEKLLEVADYISEIKKIKHPFDKGIDARVGIEY